jgi:hypothetical protein
VIRVRHEPLPAGLSAVVRRRPGGDTEIVVSTALSPARQRAAVQVGLRAARPAGGRSVLPVPLLGVLAVAWAVARALAKGIRVRPAALVATAGVVTAAAVAVVVIAVAPHPGKGHPASGGPPAPLPVPARTASPPARSAPPAAGRQHSRQPPPTVVPVAARSVAPSSRPTPAPAESPGRSAAPPSPGSSQPPSTTPSPQPSSPASAGGGGRPCLDLLGVWVCL